MYFLCVLYLFTLVPYPLTVRAQTLIDKNFGFFWQVYSCRIRNSKTIFVGTFDICLVFIFQMMTDLNVTITYIHANFLKQSQTFLSTALSLTDIGIPTTSSVSLFEYWTFFQH